MDDDLFGIPKVKKPADLELLSRYSVENDRWDRKDLDRILKNQPEVSSARKKLADNIAGEMGFDEGADVYWLLRKVSPELLDQTSIRPSRLLNRHVNEMVVDLPDYANVRRFTVGDPIASSQAFGQMEPDIERLYEKLQDQIEKQKEYEQAIKDALAAEEDLQSAEEMLQQWMDSEEDDEEKRAELEAGAAAAQGLVDDAKEAERGAASDLEASIMGVMPEIREALSEALSKANDYLETMRTLSQACGSDPGSLMRLPAEKRLDLARRLNTEKFHKMAQLFGHVIQEAFAQQKSKTIYTPAEIVDLRLGNDIPRLIPSELAKFRKRSTRLLFLKDLSQRRLVQYEMIDTEKIARGGIIYIHDGSGSMQGRREIWAKAIGLALLHIARKQKRSFYGIQFGSEREIRVDDFRDTGKLDPEKVIDFAEYFFGGGTNFESPLRHAMEILKREHEEFGAVQSDIVFVTDGSSTISDKFMTDLKTLQQKLEVTIWGIAISVGEPGQRDETRTEPLHTLCDGKVATLKTLLNATDIKEIFHGL